MAVCKTGHKVLFSSLLNSAHVHLSLMKQTGCNTLLSAVGVHIHDIMEERPSLKSILVPELHDLLDMKEPARHYPYQKTFDQAKYDPYLILHTSGTTGTPKPVIINHALPAALVSPAYLMSCLNILASTNLPGKESGFGQLR